MLALVVVMLVVVVLLCVVVTGLLRSHADIVRALHSLGVGVGDPAAEGDAVAATPVRLRAPPLPAERSSAAAPDIVGIDPSGDVVVVSTGSGGRTLLAFLTSGCTTCAGFWAALGDQAARAGLDPDVRIVVVTRGPEWESPSAVAGRAGRGIQVVMSSEAWTDYEVPGSPYFALVDGTARRRVGEGVANEWSQIVDLVARATGDVVRPATTSGRAAAGGLSGAEREASNDAELRAAGITPGHPSLYPPRVVDRPPGPASD